MKTNDLDPRTSNVARLEWILSKFVLTGQSWTAQFYLPVHKEGIRAALDEAMEQDLPF